MSNTRNFVTALAESTNSKYQELYSWLPEVFYQQAVEGYDQFYLDASLVSNNEFRKLGPNDPDLFRIYIINPKLDEESGGIIIQFQLKAIMDVASGKMVKHGSQEEGQEYLEGFRSPTYLIEPHEVENEWISEADFRNLIKYAQLWERMEAEGGDRAAYKKGNSTKRLWLAPKSEKFIFKFDLVDRINPKTSEYVYGIDNVSWDKVTIRGIGANATPNKTKKSTRSINKSGTSVDIALPPRNKSKAQNDYDYDFESYIPDDFDDTDNTNGGSVAPLPRRPRK